MAETDDAVFIPISKRVRNVETGLEDNGIEPYGWVIRSSAAGARAGGSASAEAIRSAAGIQVQSDQAAPPPPPIQRFTDVQNMPPALLHALTERGIEEPTPVQQQVIPAALSGRDVVGLAETGSGKTLAFLLPMVLMLLSRPPVPAPASPLVLIAAPTRELADQLFQEASWLLSLMPLMAHSALTHRAVLVTGGFPVGPQAEDLARGVSVLVATPGRALDLAARGALSLARVRLLVLDEADRMLELQMEAQVRALVALCPATPRQTLLFSATMSVAVERVMHSAVLRPVLVQAGAVNATLRTVTHQIRYVAQTDAKDTLLLDCLRRTERPPVIVFCNRASTVDRLVTLLRSEQFHAGGLHAQHSQAHRLRVMQLVRAGRADVLVATDLAARGLDVPDVTHVIQYDLPARMETYIHRAGRTGRAGKAGLVTAFLTRSCRIARELRQTLNLARQPVPPELERPSQFGQPPQDPSEWEEGPETQ